MTDKPFEYPDHPERGMTYWDWSLLPVKDNTRKGVNLVFTLTEVTERKQAEKDISRPILTQNLVMAYAMHVQTNSMAMKTGILMRKRKKRTNNGYVLVPINFSER